MSPLLVVQCRMVSPKPIYKQNQTDSAASINIEYEHTHTHTYTKEKTDSNTEHELAHTHQGKKGHHLQSGKAWGQIRGRKEGDMM